MSDLTDPKYSNLIKQVISGPDTTAPVAEIIFPDWYGDSFVKETLPIVQKVERIKQAYADQLKLSLPDETSHPKDLP